MEVEGRSIQKIIVDSPSESRWFRVYLVLNSPVAVRSATNDHPPRKSENTRVKWFRRLQLPSGRDHREERQLSSEAVLTENSIFCLELPEEHGPQLYSILSRLRSRLQFNIEFTAINDHPLNSTLQLCETHKTTPYARWTPKGFPMNDEHLKKLCTILFPRVEAVPGVRNKDQDKLNERKFSYIYLIMALLSRYGQTVQYNSNVFFQRLRCERSTAFRRGNLGPFLVNH